MFILPQCLTLLVLWLSIVRCRASNSPTSEDRDRLDYFRTPVKPDCSPESVKLFKDTISGFRTRDTGKTASFVPMVTAVDCGVWSPDTTKYVISIIEDLLRQCQSVNDVDDFVDRVGTLVTRVLLKNITIPTETSSITIATAFCRPQTKLNDVSKSKNTASKMYENPHKPFSTDVANGMLRFESFAEQDLNPDGIRPSVTETKGPNKVHKSNGEVQWSSAERRQQFRSIYRFNMTMASGSKTPWLHSLSLFRFSTQSSSPHFQTEVSPSAVTQLDTSTRKTITDARREILTRKKTMDTGQETSTVKNIMNTVEETSTPKKTINTGRKTSTPMKTIDPGEETSTPKRTVDAGWKPSWRFISPSSGLTTPSPNPPMPNNEVIPSIVTTPMTKKSIDQVTKKENAFDKLFEISMAKPKSRNCATRSYNLIFNQNGVVNKNQMVSFTTERQPKYNINEWFNRLIYGH